MGAIAQQAQGQQLQPLNPKGKLKQLVEHSWPQIARVIGGKLKPPTKWPVHVTAIIHPLTHGRFDPENAAPMVKAILDAITQADFWPDDNARYVVGPDYRLGEPSTEKGVYHITIRIEEEEL